MEDTGSVFIDQTYEFSAPKFFDFINGESEAETRNAELWFDTAISHAPSPFMPRIKTGRSVVTESLLCDFSEADQPQKKVSQSADSTVTNCASETKPQSEMMPAEIKEEELTPNEAKEENNASLVNLVSADEEATKDKDKGGVCTLENGSDSTEGASSAVERKTNDNKSLLSLQVETEACTPKQPTISHKENQTDLKNLKAEKIRGTEACTPKPPMTSQNANLTDSKKHQTAKKIASLVKNPSALKPKNHSQLSQAKGKPPSSVRRDPRVKNPTTTHNLAQEYQAIKRQKLEGGKTRQILNVKPQNLPHKGSSNLCPSTAKTSKEDRKVYVREAAAPFVSMAEMMRKFQSNTRGMSLPNLNSSLSHGDATSIIQRRPKLTLTRPKEPELETTNRVRSVRVKSTAELEEEMMAKIPKFKARPLNKKILEAATLPAVPRSVPQLPVFQEFHLETMTRANQNAESSTVASTESSSLQNHQWNPHHLTEPKTPLLQTSLRARPPRVKSSVELEQEALEKVLPFKARPLNKKIFESKGGLGIFCNTKRQVTKPQEFHFATDERIPPPQASVTDLFDKLSLNSEPHRDNHPIPRITKPNPFHLHTEDRGTEKETKFVMKVMEKEMEEEKARVPRAHPYPYTTDYPVIPPKPEPKPCTKPEPFQLESLVRHEEEMLREMEERKRMEKEEAERRRFKAQPVLKEDPIPLPEKARKPLTQVQEFNHHVDHRAVDRAEFDERIKEKEQMYKRYREESESARLMEEEKALKQLRRTLVPHARAVPNFDRPFCPQKSSKETTKAKSPYLRVLQRKERRKMTLATATSAAANNMR
ncbi:hypothetical protein VitviT2T_017662 [Vitis vinifera]|uniref:Protein TPX2 n=2 Tax=Vitis vinifera TaxID=29760 RepID=A0ABY9CVB3_VITVI|eukprot:XP_010656995.1 PREDICTED: protein TPX2 [Vitis vinifera]